MYAAAIRTLTLAGLVLAPLPGLATHDREGWARVVEVRPVIERVRIPERQDRCWDRQVERAVPERRSATPLILGAVIGGVVGHQFGGGRGNDLMTAAGAALGTSIAADQQARRYPPRYARVTETHCSPRTEWREEIREVAWDVTYEYRGELYETRLYEPPGEHIRVRVVVQPLD